MRRFFEGVMGGIIIMAPLIITYIIKGHI